MGQGAKKRAARKTLDKTRLEVLNVEAAGAGDPEKTLDAAYARLDRIGAAHDGDRAALAIDDETSAQLRACVEQLEDELADEDKPLSRDDFLARLQALYGRFGPLLVAAALSEPVMDYLAEVEAAKASIAAEAEARAAWFAKQAEDPAVAERREKSLAYDAALRSGDYTPPAQDEASSASSFALLRKSLRIYNAKRKREGLDFFSQARDAHAARGLSPDGPLPYGVMRHTAGFSVQTSTRRGLENMISWDLKKVAAHAEACAAANDITRKAKSSDETWCILPRPEGGFKIMFSGRVPGVPGAAKGKILYLRGADGVALVFATNELARTARDAFFAAEEEDKKKMLKKPRKKPKKC